MRILNGMRQKIKILLITDDKIVKEMDLKKNQESGDILHTKYEDVIKILPLK